MKIKILSLELRASAGIKGHKHQKLHKTDKLKKVQNYFFSIKHLYLEKKQDRDYSRMLGAVLNKFWKQHPAKQQLYYFLPSISQAIQVRWTRHIIYGWRSRLNHKRYCSADSLTWTHQIMQTSKDVYSSALCGHWIPSWGPFKRNV